MDPLSLSFIASATGGELWNVEATDMATGLSTDSRSLSRGDLFVALVGERHDAHGFLTPEMGRVASACMVERGRLGEELSGLPLIQVENSRAALGRLGSQYRGSFNLPVVCVTGSNGKTSTKRFLQTVLSARYQVCASPASFNNDIGVPLSLMNLEAQSTAGVFEVGTNHPGEIKPLVEMVKPNIGVMTSLGRSHMEFFGSVEAIADEKGWLAELLPAEGLFVVNGDMPHLERVLERVRARVVKVGFGEGNDWIVRSEGIGTGGMDFSVAAPAFDGACRFHLPVIGRHHLINATLAMAVGSELGLTPDELVRMTAQCEPAPMRADWESHGGVVVFDDTYNANADSMIAALQTLKDYPLTGARWAVVGDMGELGEFSAAGHREVGQIAAELGIDHVVGVGEWAGEVCAAARKGGVSSTYSFTEAGDVLPWLEPQLTSGDGILLKASRSTGLEGLAATLRSQLEQRSEHREEHLKHQ